MAIEEVRLYLQKWGRDTDILEFEQSSATVELAAKALQVDPARIAKTICLRGTEGPILLVTAGDAKIDNAKFKRQFGMKARMLEAEEVLAATGHAIGGVCPFGLPIKLPVYLDISLKRFITIFPACGSSNSAIELTCAELEEYAEAQGWIDVCKAWTQEMD